MKLRTKVHEKYRASIEKTDIVALLVDSEKYRNNKQFVISLLQNKVSNPEKEIKEILQSLITETSNYYSSKLVFRQNTTNQTLEYQGKLNCLPSWFEQDKKINNYYVENILDDNIKMDLKLLDENIEFRNNYKFEYLSFENAYKSLLKEESDEIIDKKNKLLFWTKIIFFILILIALILMILFFII